MPLRESGFSFFFFFFFFFFRCLVRACSSRSKIELQLQGGVIPYLGAHSSRPD
ncbi:hypothetical protein [Noviherbaspirillum aerium]|uniref:hypothetical protein n=1 Tax=Noviherbaspirillum aerium TaxID=2588497 RepID=UPI00178C7B0A|nr:hypothetical protein [Noviherbaspirillum aerium]